MTPPAKVSVISPMLTLLTQPGVQYQPERPNLPLLPETGDPRASLENVRLMMNEGLTYSLFIAGPAGVVLNFQTGESILLTGFALGGGPRTEALALAAHEIGLGPQEELAGWYTDFGKQYGSDYIGPVPEL